MYCIFCKIVAGDIPNYQVYEDEEVLAFFDVLPISPGHTIIVPKKHYADLEEIPDKTLSAMIVAAKKIGKAIMEGMDVKGYSIFLDNKDAANQHVPHAHFHLVPRKEGDGLQRWPQSGYAEDEAEFFLKKIKDKL
jgi:histidine triad (HIT) family protein